MPAATCSAVTPSVGLDLRIGAAREQQLHQHDVARLRRAQKRRRAVLVEPLVGEHRARLGAVLHARVHVGALVEQQLDEVEVIHVALADRIIAVLDVAVVGREIERHPAAFVGEVRIGAVVEQIRAELVVAVLRRDQQRAPAVRGRLVDVGAGREQHLHRLEIVRARREHERRQPAAVFRRGPAAAERRDNRIVVLVEAVSVCSRRRAAPPRPRPPVPASARRVRARRPAATSRRPVGRAAVESAELTEAGNGLTGGDRRAECRDGSPRIARLAERRSASALGGRRLRLDVGAAVDQQLDRGRVAFVGRPHQRRGAAQRVLRVHVGAVVEQHRHRVDVAGARRDHQRRASERQLLVGVGAAFDERREDRRVAVDAGQPQRRRAFAVRRLDVRARANEQHDELAVAAIDRPVQRGRAVVLRRVDVGLLADQRANRRLVAAHRRVGDVRLSGAHAGRQREHNQCECRESLPHRAASFPSLSPMLSWLMPNLSRTVSSRLPVGTVLLG